MLRYGVFLIFIILGFLLSHHRKLYPIVVVVYGIALFYYTFLSRMELSTTTEAVVATSAPVQQHWWVKAAYEVLRMKTSSYREACILNAMLFVPMGYLVRCKKPWMTILICSSLSLTIELLQELTGFGMFDLNDWGANTVGAGIGVILLWGCNVDFLIINSRPFRGGGR